MAPITKEPERVETLPYTDEREDNVHELAGASLDRGQRVQIEFSAEATTRLREIKRLANIKTNADVLRSSLRLFDWFLERRSEGWRVQLVKDDTVKEVEFIF